MAGRTADSDGGSMTPSENSETEERSDRDSDYESDEEEENKEQLNIQWTGYGKKTPVVLFCPDAILQKKPAKKTVGERYHMTYKFGGSECKLVRNIFNFHGFHEVHPNSSDFNLIWTGGHLKPFTLRAMTEFQKINHFPRSYELTRKDRLFKNIQRMQQIKGAKHFDFIPPSFILPSEYQDFCAAFLREKGTWIVKPVASSRGRGVFLCNHPDQVPLDENLIVCKYVSNPLLIDGFKFDVRLYVCVTSYDPLSIYLFEEGLTRFATVKYERGNKHIRNQCMHLTNYSVNKKNDDYVKNDDPDVEDYGNKWSLGALLRYLRAHGKDTATLMMRVEDVIIKSILSVEMPVATACKMFMPHRGNCFGRYLHVVEDFIIKSRKYNQEMPVATACKMFMPDRVNCFELYGFDILIDENLKPWVLEVNLSPSLACDSPLDMKIKTNLICDVLSLTGIVCHDPMMRTLQQSKRNQEVTAKIAARAKRQRPQSASSVASSSAAGGNKNSNNNNKQGGMAGLNSEEIKIFRRLKEEDARKRGWVRIFPSPDSWDLYSTFMQFQTSHNLMVHNRLYPERHKTNTAQQKGAVSTSVGQRARSAYSSIGGLSSKSDAEYAECYAQAILRTRQYERKLGTARPGRRRRHRRKKIEVEKSRPKLAQGVVDDGEEDEDEVQEKEDSDQSDVNDDNERAKGGNSRASTPEVDSKLNDEAVIEVEKELAATSSNSQVSQSEPPSKNSTQAEKLPPKPPPHPIKLPVKKTEEEKVEEPSPPPPKPVEPKYNVVGMLQKGGTLNKCQARSAFAMYLVRVQQRLMSENSPSSQDDSDALNEQMDLVLRFLKRAAINLQQPFKVVVPSRKLPLNDRRRILAQQLGDFVHIYNKETDQLNSKRQQEKKQGKISEVHPGSSPENVICENKFDKFVNTASEGELEEVLTTYTKINKSASIFLGGNPKHGSSDSSHPRPGGASSNIHNRPPSGSSQRSTTVSGSTSHPSSHTTSTTTAGNTGLESRSGVAPPMLASEPYLRNYQTPSQSSYANAVHIYTQKLTSNRPRSATSGSQRTGNRPVYNRPMSAVNRPVSSNPYATTDPTVDSYNDQAIHEALQRLALRQQARQYSAYNSTHSLVGEDGRSRPSSAKSSGNNEAAPQFSRSTSAVENLTYTLHGGPSHSVYKNSNGQSEYIHKQPNPTVHIPESESYKRNEGTKAYQTNGVISEDVTRSRPPSGQGQRRSEVKSASTNSRKPFQTNVNLQNANATFNSFIEDSKGGPWQNDLALAYNQVTGVLPSNYHTATQSSKQYQLLQQQALKEQSKALLEQSKAKHQAMVAQAHAVHKSIQQQKQPASTEVESAVQKYAPKPPMQPSHTKKLPAHTEFRGKPCDHKRLVFVYFLCE
ncbi:hypothetical protein FSP39_017678 [Pinctada imbricata]|uniref:Tubulin--tyrosine ligase-like protein 5 n=1 Tax=Pinctada imbricata TaxID=66713 RepID=A0AA89BWR1_PINIB|nr:hypothetical protein FSP39_017678 [Pinctada imbricata]